jgi:hypothetical protein
MRSIRLFGAWSTFPNHARSASAIGCLSTHCNVVHGHQSLQWRVGALPALCHRTTSRAGAFEGVHVGQSCHAFYRKVLPAAPNGADRRWVRNVIATVSHCSG